MAHVMLHGTIKPLHAGDPAVQAMIEEKVPLVPTDLTGWGEIDFEATRQTIGAIADAVVARMLEQLGTIEQAEQARRAAPEDARAENAINN